MSSSTTSKKQTILITYEKHYDSFIIRSLVKTVGEDEALSILEHCSGRRDEQYEKYKINFEFVMEDKVEIFINTVDLITQLMIKHKGHEGIEKLNEEIHQYMKKYLKPVEDLRARGKIQDAIPERSFRDGEIKSQMEAYEITCRTYLEEIQKLPSPWGVVVIKRYEEHLADGVEKCIINDPVWKGVICPQARPLLAIAMTLKETVEEIMGKEVCEKLQAECNRKVAASSCA